MATINGIISIIKEKYQYLTPDIQTIVKNTVPMTGLCLRTANSNTAPCIYIDNLINSSVSDEDAVEHIMHIYHSAKLNIDLSLFYLSKSPRYNFLGLQRKLYRYLGFFLIGLENYFAGFIAAGLRDTLTYSSCFRYFSATFLISSTVKAFTAAVYSSKVCISYPLKILPKI